MQSNPTSHKRRSHLRALGGGLRTFDDFVREGIIEYLDVNEENDALIAMYPSDLRAYECSASFIYVSMAP